MPVDAGHLFARTGRIADEAVFDSQRAFTPYEERGCHKPFRCRADTPRQRVFYGYYRHIRIPVLYERKRLVKRPAGDEFGIPVPRARYELAK
jgi:hypothetical protein